jgi:hypothetical protein
MASTLNKALTLKQGATARRLIREGSGTEGILKQFKDRISEPYQAERIKRTEGTRIASMKFQAQANRSGQKRFSISAHPQACQVCKSKGGSHNIDNGGLPPYHPNCRCQAH